MGRRNKNNQNNYPYQNGQYYNGQYNNQNGYYNGQYYNNNGQYYNQNGQYYNNQYTNQNGYYNNNNTNNKYSQYNQNYGYNYQNSYQNNNQNKKKTPFNLSKTTLIGIGAFIVFVILIIVTVIIINVSGDDDGNVIEKPPIDEKTTKQVGNSTLGYVEIPDEWVKFKDVNAVRGLQYSSEDAKYIITLDAMATSEVDAETYAKAVAAQLEKEGVKDLSGSMIKISNYEAYQVSGYYDKENIWLYVWCFEAEDGNTHYIGIEGPDDDNEYFQIFKTFKLKK